MRQLKKELRMLGLLLVHMMIIIMCPQVLARDINTTKNEMTKERVKAFVDERVPRQLEKYNIAGATVAIVKDGQVLYEKAYGERNGAEGVNADTDTMFRIGSVTKLFTWTALMQLEEKGQLSLEDDISQYLGDIKLGGNQEEPIRIRHLMTHTAGIEDKFSNLFMTKDGQIPPLEKVLLEDQRMRIFHPDEVIAYSNYGAALGGRIIEVVSGVDYETYIRKNILDPLGMERTTLHQPASALYDNVAKGNMWRGEAYQVFEDAFTPLPPIGAMSASAKDMTKFMLMHLNQGTYNGQKILETATVEKMHTTQYTSDERLPGICLGFIEWNRNGKRMIWHSGGTALFKTLCMLIPEENVGVFISYNSPNSGKARNEFRQNFLDTFYPYYIADTEPLADYKERAKKFKGYYREGRVGVYNSDKLIFALSRLEKVKVTEDGTIIFRGTEYVVVEPLVFREVKGQGKLIFREGENQQIKYAFQDFEPHEAYIKVKWFETPQVCLGIFVLCLSVFLTVLVGAGIRRIANKRRQKTKQNSSNNGKGSSEDKSMNSLLDWICGLHLLVPVGAILGFGIEIMMNPRVMTTGVVPLLFKISLMAPVIGGALTAGVLYRLIRGWKVETWTFRRRMLYAMVIITSCTYIGWLYSYNLLGTYR